MRTSSSPSTTNPPSPSLARTGLRAGTAFAGSAAWGLVLAILLGGGLFFVYLGRLNGPGNVAARAGGAGAVLALITSPPTLVALLLLAFVPLYAFLGVARGRARAMSRVVQAHGDALARRLAQAVAGRIEALPRAHGALDRAAGLMSPEALAATLAPVLGGRGEGRVVRTLSRWVLARLPLAEVMAEWRRLRGDAAPVDPGQEDPVLRTLLAGRIGDTLRDLAEPSRAPLWIALAAHAAIFALGFWLTR